MSLVKDASTLVDTPVRASRKQDLRVISEMSSVRIVSFLTYRHRVGLLALCTFCLLFYVVWDKVGRFLV